MNNVLLISVLLFWLGLSVGCGAKPQPVTSGSTTSAEQGEQGSDQWIQFGVILEVQPMKIASSSEHSDGMRLEIVLDNGRSLVVEQPLSQAGELRVGDRVRVLRIGGFSRATFWPYPTQ